MEKNRKARWLRARLAEKRYAGRLQQIARHVSAIIRGFDGDYEDASLTALQKTLVDYAELIGPWATSVARYMLIDVDRRNERAWKEHADDIGVAIRRELEQTPTGAVFRSLLAEQVRLIKSLPLDSARRVHEMVQEALPKSTRSTTLAAQLAETAHIPKWRAKLIARTEVSRAAVTLTQVRAEAIGSEGYIWQTAGDADVRPEHKRMQGKYVAWNDPPSFASEPTLGAYHAGAGPNCRCWPVPVLPDF